MVTKEFLLAKAGREVMACVGFAELVERMDFAAIHAAISASHDVEAWGEPGYSVEHGIATIKVRGLLVPDLGYDLSSWGLTGYDIITKYLENADEDTNVVSAVLDIDSPGGYTSGLGAAADAIAAFTKPIVAHASGDAYSAAYWLGVTPGEFTANQHSGIGSIGVYVEFFDRTGMLEKNGILRSIFRSGFWKGAFSPYAPLSDREKERLQADVDEQARLFFEHVAAHRNVTADAVAALDGDYFNAAKALEIGLIDQILENPTMSTNAQGSAAQPSNPTQAAAPAAAATYTQDQLDAAVKAAADKAAADALDHQHRQDAINALDASDEVKAMLASDKYQNVATADLAALVAIMPKSVEQQLNAHGGAGVKPDPTNFAPKTDADAKEDKNAAALATIASKKGVIL